MIAASRWTGTVAIHESFTNAVSQVGRAPRVPKAVAKTSATVAAWRPRIPLTVRRHRGPTGWGAVDAGWRGDLLRLWGSDGQGVGVLALAGGAVGGGGAPGTDRASRAAQPVA